MYCEEASGDSPSETKSFVALDEAREDNVVRSKSMDQESRQQAIVLFRFVGSCDKGPVANVKEGEVVTVLEKEEDWALCVSLLNEPGWFPLDRLSFSAIVVEAAEKFATIEPRKVPIFSMGTRNCPGDKGKLIF